MKKRMKTKSNKIGICNIFYIIKLFSSQNNSKIIANIIPYKIHQKELKQKFPEIDKL